MLVDKIYNYVERKFQQSGCTQFPTVRMVAKSLKIRQIVVQDEVEGCPLGNIMLTSYYCSPPESLGDHWVETI